MTSLPKIMEKSDLLETKQIIFLTYILTRAIKNVVLIEFEPLCEKLLAFLSNFGHFRMPTHQIWSYHVTQEANFEIFLFCPNSTFNIMKSHKICSGKALYFKSYQSKASRWTVKHPPPLPPPTSAFGVQILYSRKNI